MNKKIIVFDVCGTIFHSNTTLDFIDFFLFRYEYSDKKLVKKIYKLTKNLTIRRLNRLSKKLLGLDFIRIFLINILSSYSKTELKNAFEMFYESELKYNINNEVLFILREDLKGELPVFLCSASLDFIIECISEKLGVSNYFSSKLLYKNNICMGCIQKDLLGKKLDVLDGFIVHKVVTDNLDDLNVCLSSEKSIILSNCNNLSYWELSLSGKDYEVIKL